MNDALSYLLIRRFFNNTRNLVRKPARLILILFLVAMIGFTIFAGNMAEAEEGIAYRDIRELEAIVTALYLIIFLMMANNGFEKGGTLFQMPDVNLCFPSPLSQQSLLFYGLIQQMGMSLLVGICILFQYTSVHTQYGVNYGDLIGITAGFAASTFCGQLTAMLIYTKTSSSTELRKRVKRICYIVVGALTVIVVVTIKSGFDRVLTGAVTLGSGAVMFFPGPGWISYAIRGMLERNVLYALIGIAGFAVFIGAAVVALTHGNDDYYEDVLGVTETQYKTAQLAKKGQAAQTTKNRKRGVLAHGEGAKMFFHKHNLENKRQNALYLEPQTIIFDLFSIGFALVMREEAGIAAGFAFAAYMMMMSAALGRMPKELVKPYIYLIPEPPFKKLFWAIAESYPKNAINCLIVFLPMAIFCGLTVPEIIICVLAGFSFTCLFQSGQVCVERIFKDVTSTVLAMVVYMLSMVVFCIPGGILAIVLPAVGTVLISTAFTVFLAFAVMNTLMALLLLWLCRNMLQYAEMNMK